MEDQNRNYEPENTQTTPYQTPVRGADEQPGSGYHNTNSSTDHSANSSADTSAARSPLSP